jgi:glycosyltransferase involved in cell wall biosynthesis
VRIAFLGNFLAKRAKQGEGSSAHFFGVADGLRERGHTIFLPGSDAAYFDQARHFSSLNPLSLRSIDVAYIRMEGRPVQAPWYLQNRVLRKLLAPSVLVVWEVNAAPEMLAFDGTHCSPATLRALEHVLRQQARLVDAAICNTKGLSHFATDLGIPKTLAIELATFPEKFAPAHHSAAALEVCWVAGNSRVSWHDTKTILAAARLLTDSPFIRFHLIGDIAPSEWPSNVILHGRVPNEKLGSVLKHMDVGLAIYHSGAWSRYGVFTSPLKVFDYMAAGLCVVASPIEQIQTLIMGGAFVRSIPFHDSVALARALRQLRKDSEFLEGCLNNRRLATGYYNWRRVSAHTEAFFYSLLGGAPTPNQNAT